LTDGGGSATSLLLLDHSLEAAIPETKILLGEADIPGHWYNVVAPG
jgi:hypothetical protein